MKKTALHVPTIAKFGTNFWYMGESLQVYSRIHDFEANFLRKVSLKR